MAMNGVKPNGHVTSPAISNNVPNGTSATMQQTNGSIADMRKGNSTAIAIVGMACRLPGNVTSPDEFWDMCARARSGWSETPKDRFSHEGYYHPNPDKSGCFNPKGGHFLQEDLSLFDAPFFNITAQEAKSLDPQQRLMLECAYEALENGGIPKHQIVGQNVGVFVGGSFADYEIHNLRDTETIPMYQATGCAASLLSNRLSYYFDLRGPSATVDTACSSSLSALHLACQSLRTGESSHAIVGGCHLNILPDYFITMSLSRLFSDEGKSFSFDHRATSGFGRGEGAGCIILKPLEDAIKAGDSVRAVILGSGTNQDGRTAGITTPSRNAQETLIRSVYDSAGLDVKDTGFVEAHGTGTKTGDPIEAAALGAVFGQGRTPKDPLYIGSVKSNIGHAEGASGVISVIKMAMMLERGFILPNCDFEKPSEHTPLSSWNLKVPASQKMWPRTKKYGSVNNFGFGGTNAHVVLGKAPRPLKTHTNGTVAKIPVIDATAVKGSGGSPERKLYVLSANDKEALNQQMRNLEIYLEQRPEAFEKALMGKLAYTLGQRRSILSWKIAVSATSALNLIRDISGANVVPTRGLAEELKIGFVFTGQGAQWYAMGRELMKSHSVFLSVIEEADRCLKHLGAPFSLFDELNKDPEDSLLAHAHISQPSCTGIQIALVALLNSWGVHPTAVAGHSSGEIAAAYAAGILRMDECLKIAYYRGSAVMALKSEHPKIRGAMLAVGCEYSKAESLLECLHSGQAKIACVNSPSNVTVSGDESAICQLQMLLDEKQIFNRRLHVDVAYHSSHMCLVAEGYRSAIGQIHPQESPHATFYSSLTGEKVEAAALQPSYWVDNLTCPVLFSQAVQSLCGFNGQDATSTGLVNMLVEIGPHSALQGPIKQILKASPRKTNEVHYAPSLVRGKDALEAMLQLASTLFVKGCFLDMAAINFPNATDTTSMLLTDLPKYPWQHNTKHWHEPRISHNHRFRRWPRNDIVGALADDSNDLEPRWRNIIRTEDLPWLRHHKVQSTIVYPIAGYIAMAMEAASQRAMSREIRFDKFVLREVSTSQALVVPEETDVETMISLRPYSEGTRLSSDVWDEFRIFSWATNRGWTEHCRGLIAVQKSKQANPVDGLRQLQDETTSMKKRISTITMASTCPVDSPGIYDGAARVGVEYGPLFQGLSDCKACDTAAFAHLKIPDTAAFMPYNYEPSFVIHPATLDLCLQIVWPMLGAGRTDLNQLYLPSFAKDITISRHISKEATDVLRIYGSGSPKSNTLKSVPFSIFATDSDDAQDSLISLEGLVMTPVYDKVVESMRKMGRELCYKPQWTPHLDSLTPGQLQELFSLDRSEVEGKHSVRTLEEASLYFIKNANQQVTPEQYSSMRDHHKRFYDWSQRQCQLAEKGYLRLQTPQWTASSVAERQNLLNSLRSSGATGEMICKVGNNLPQILRQEVEPLSIMLEDDLLDRYYVDLDSFNRSYAQAALYVDKLADQNPNINVLEIGAGTGGATLPILEALGGSHGKVPRFKHYDYTDVSGGFFDSARAKFSAWDSLLTYRKLDIETDPMTQGFDSEGYDLIVACNVLHVTAEMERTMRNVRRLLKPGGKILLIEQTTRNLRQFIYGVLPGWWLGTEPNRIDGPTLAESEWDCLLKSTDFSGIDFCLQDYPAADEQCGSMMISTALSTQTDLNAEVVILCGEDMHSNFPLSRLKDTLQELTGKPPVVGPLGETNTEGKICIFLGELEQPFLNSASRLQFEQVQQLCRTAKGILWVVRGAYADSQSPDANMAIGLARTIRSETALPFVTLDLDQRRGLSKMQTADMILEVFKATFASCSPASECDMEFMERGGMLSVPRIVNDCTMNKFIHQETHSSYPELQPFLQPGRPLKMAIESPGSLDTLYFKDDETLASPLAEDYVEIEIKATGLNFKDIMVAMGRLSIGHLGVECSGVIKAIGREVSDFAVGDRVCAISEGGFSNFVRCAATSVSKIADDLSFDVAAAIPVVYCTAYHSLFNISHLCKGESILIHAAAGGVGQAAIVFAQMIGAEIFATVGSAEKKGFLSKEYNLPEDHIFFSRDTSFKKGILAMTEGKGVDVVLNSLSQDALQATWECLAHFGRFVEIGKRDIMTNTRLEMASFANNTTFAAVDLVTVASERPLLMKKLLADVFDLHRKGIVRPISPIITFPISDVESAFRTLQGGKRWGKIVVQPYEGNQIKALPSKTPANLFCADASYVLVGGTGGLGRSMTRFMVQKGAKHIILVSRSDHIKENVRVLIEDLERLGANVVVRQCDVAQSEDVKMLVAQSLRDMPPIRGVIHGAMVLQDVLFERSTYDEYDSVVKPKVSGAWNLHRHLIEQELDFFITLSSAAGVVGNKGQAAYAAASTFLSAFAQYRVAQGFPATNLDLGAVKGVGYLAENLGKQAEVTDLFGEEGVSETELHALLSVAVRGKMAACCNSHCITGLKVHPNMQAPFWLADAKFSHLRRALAADLGEKPTHAPAVSLSHVLKQARSTDDALSLVHDGLAAKVSSVLMVPLDEINSERPLVAYGLDSLVAVEIRNWISRELGANLQVLELLTSGSLIKLAGTICAKSDLVAKKPLETNGVVEKMVNGD